MKLCEAPQDIKDTADKESDKKKGQAENSESEAHTKLQVGKLENEEACLKAELKLWLAHHDSYTLKTS